ncbi:MAG: (E)-4-hydroxy-3-methylbut-2-enyl-diphosphate synthase, partial [Akkermansia sp.]|nr:(E)-4-hydroxy-3-methylbut-2-enyl-diphosphate synthase [Akkermansia sp.]
MSTLLHCPSLYQYTRRCTREVQVGNLGLGGQNPIRIQSMLTSDTLDTAGCVRGSLALAEAGCEIIRLTAQTKVYAANLENIARELRAAGCHVPLVADIHFKPDAAMEAAKWVEKIRVNPGNFVDKKKFLERDYTDFEYEEELERVRKAFTPLVLFCKEHGRAMRLGANHGSLSDRILNRYGDTPEGMVESALEFARVARDLNYHRLVFSMKSSNVKVMIQAYRLLVRRLAEEGADWNYPIHLGVTEAGEGEDARIKSATGIGSLLADGIGDTLRVSLTEDPVFEVAPGFELAAPYQPGVAHPQTELATEPAAPFDPYVFTKRKADVIKRGEMTLGWNEPVRVVLPKAACEALSPEKMKDFMPELAYEDCAAVEVDPRSADDVAALADAPATLVTVKDGVEMPVVQAFRLLAAV